jgi:hypothetical protein
LIAIELVVTFTARLLQAREANVKSKAPLALVILQVVLRF